jgi:GrpB-like predicted nucleotidyltransferase (UPF0157 family)
MNKLGLADNEVKLLNYTSAWKVAYQREREKISNAIRPYICAIEHIGSTAIENIYAKPIIDIAVALRNANDIEKTIEPMKKIGYIYKGEQENSGRFFFKPDTEIVKFHVHMMAIDNPIWISHIKFRDFLRKDMETAKEYENLKLNLQKRFPDNREEYTNGKDEFIKKILKQMESKEG